MTATTAISRTSVNDCWNRIGVHGDGSCPELKQHIHCRNCPVYTDAAAHLLNSSAPSHYLTEWTRHYARPKTVVELDTHVFFIFRLGAEWLALPVDILKEVAPLESIHSLPHRQSGAVRGITNVRGELLVCLALDKVLGLELPAVGQANKRLELRRLLVIKDKGGPLAFSVDEAYGIHSCPSRELTEVPATVARATAVYTHAVLPWNGNSVGCLDRQLLLAALNRSLV